jgi:8-amino-7-oxononanoate synthase
MLTCGRMNPFDRELESRLAALREQGLFRELHCLDSPQAPRIELKGRTLLNFSSNDYLGLANHPAVKEAAIKAVEQSGAGAGASRLVSGSLAPHHQLEAVLAAFKGTEAALSFSSGYATAFGVICALLGRDDVIVIDKLVHACVVDAAKLSGARLRVFAHNDLNDLEKILKWADARNRDDGSGPFSGNTPGRRPHILMVTESVFSMDGDCASLREIVALKEKYGAWLMLDEAHATGLYGKNRRGLAEALGLDDRIEIQMGTLGKALGAGGGYICGSRLLVDYCINRARTFVFSTAPIPAAAAAATAGIGVVRSAEGEERNRKVWELAKLLEHSAGAAGVEITAPDSLIMPVIAGDENKAMEWAAALRARGVFVPAIRYPSVARGAARLRITLTAAHSAADVKTLVSALSQIANRQSSIPLYPNAPARPA